MNQAQNPLDQLRDIHAPPTLEAIQLAPGWWVLIGLLFVFLIFIAYRTYKKRKSLAILKPANEELRNIAALTPNNHAVAKLSGLLKRICLIYFNQSQVAALSGKTWVEFLNQEFGRTFFDEEQQQLFSSFAYQKEQQLDDNAWQQLICNSQLAIDTIIRQSVRNHKHA